MKNKKSGYVYVATVNEMKGYCKIGYTRKDPIKRVCELSKGYPDLTFTLVDYFECDFPTRTEAMTHRVLMKNNYCREIFKVRKTSAMRIIKLVDGKRFSVTSEADLLGFNCVNSDGLYYACDKNRNKASKVINRMCRKHGITGLSQSTPAFSIELTEAML